MRSNTTIFNINNTMLTINIINYSFVTWIYGAIFGGCNMRSNTTIFNINNTMLTINIINCSFVTWIYGAIDTFYIIYRSIVSYINNTIFFSGYIILNSSFIVSESNIIITMIKCWVWRYYWWKSIFSSSVGIYRSWNWAVIFI